MYYHFAIILLFRPFFKLKFSASAVSPRTMCVDAASSILSLLSSYANLYNFRRTSFIVPHIVLATMTIHLAEMSEPPVPKLLRWSIDALTQMYTCNTSASSSLKLIRSLASEQGFCISQEDTSSPVMHRRSQCSGDAGPPDEKQPSRRLAIRWNSFEATAPSNSAFPRSVFDYWRMPVEAGEEDTVRIDV